MPKITSDAPSRAKAKSAKLCCCPPRALLWIDTRTTAIFVENRIEESRHFEVRADVANSINQPQPDVASDGAANSEMDQTIIKNQGKVYRSDSYTIHWKGLGECQPVQVTLSVSGETSYSAHCLPEEGEVTLSHVYLLEPPDYRPPGPGFVTATLEVVDCSQQTGLCENTVQRP